MARAEKDKFVAEMKQELEKAAGFLFVDYTGLTVAEADRLRKKTREAEVTYRVVKNTLMGRVLADTPYSAANDCLKGTPTAVVLGWQDPVTPAKITFEFLKECEHLKVKGGVVDNRAISVAEAEALAKLPSKQELQGAVVALAQSPGRNVLAQLKSPAGKLLGAIEALADKLQSNA